MSKKAKKAFDYDFSGYATKAGVRCSDGRVITKDAFKHQDGHTVPLIWQHFHEVPTNILGKAYLEHRDDGIYAYCKFNGTPDALHAKESVKHGDINYMSIFAKELKQQAKTVMHGMIKEVSLVISGANPGAVIENINFAHGDGSVDFDEEEAIIHTGINIVIDESDDQDASDDVKHSDTDDTKADDKAKDKADDDLTHAEDDTVEEIYNAMSQEQKDAVHYFVGAALEQSVQHSNINDEGDDTMKKNVFDQTIDDGKNTLTHDQLKSILKGAKAHGSLKESFLAHAEEYGFDPIEVLFPDAKDAHGATPLTYKRPDDWVAGVLSAVNKTPFSRVRTRIADLTHDEARAKGYITGNRKKEEIIPLMKRVTEPTTVYKKQKIDRDDMVDITDFDVVVWLRREMREMLNEELARAILIGDGRDVSDEDKINEQNIRPIANDDGDIFVHRVLIAPDRATDEIIDDIIRSKRHYRGSGAPKFYASPDLITEMLLIKDKNLRRIYANNTELAQTLRVNSIEEVEVMDGATRTHGDDVYEILGIIVNLKDYTVGANKGGEVNLFDDFDIDYNQHKYLIETRCSGALTRPKSAIVIEKKRPAGSGTPAG